jgi:hypothetical protein
MGLNRELSELFHSLSALMELRGDDVFNVFPTSGSCPPALQLVCFS